MRLSKSVVGYKEASAVSDIIINCGYLGMGEYVGLFEKEIEAYVGNPAYKAVCVNSGTAALHLAIAAVTKPGDEVLVPTFTFVATYQAILAAHCVPVSCDIDPDTLLIDLKDAEKRITDKTKVVLPVFYASNTSNRAEVYAFAKKHNLRVVEDAAHAFGCVQDGKKIGADGDMVCFSFDGIKNITSGEGGCIMTSDPVALQYVQDARLLGVMKDSEKRYAGLRSWDFDVQTQGYRYHMSNIFAGIGRVQLKRLDSEFAPKRKSLAKRYYENLHDVTGVKLIKGIDFNNTISFIYPVMIQNGRRDAIKHILNEAGVPTGVHYKPNHLLSLFKTDYALPVSMQVYEEIMTLPMHPELSLDEVDMICNLIKANL